MTTNSAIKTLESRLKFVDGRINKRNGSSYDKAERLALKYAVIRMKQYNFIMSYILNNEEIVNGLRKIEDAEGQHLIGAIWKDKND